MIKDVNVTIDIQNVVGALGLGYPLIVFKNTSAVAYAETDLQTARNTYTAIDDVIDNIMSGTNPPEKIAVIGLAEVTEETVTVAINAVMEKGWRQLVIADSDFSATKTFLTAIEATDKMLFIPTAALPTLSGGDTWDYERVVAVSGSTFADAETGITNIACILGATCGQEVGSFTYKNTIVNNGSVMDNAAYRTATASTASNPPFLAILEKCGDNVISDGLTVGGDYIDVIDSKDYIINQLEYKTQKTLNNQKKVPYTNNGVAMLESVAIDVLNSAYNNGMIAEKEDGSPDYSVNYALREDSTAEDIQARKYIGGKFGFVLSGAIHTVKINGTIKYV